MDSRQRVVCGRIPPKPRKSGRAAHADCRPGFIDLAPSTLGRRKTQGGRLWFVSAGVSPRARASTQLSSCSIALLAIRQGFPRLAQHPRLVSAHCDHMRLSASRPKARPRRPVPPGRLSPHHCPNQLAPCRPKVVWAAIHTVPNNHPLERSACPASLDLLLLESEESVDASNHGERDAHLQPARSDGHRALSVDEVAHRLEEQPQVVERGKARV